MQALLMRATALEFISKNCSSIFVEANQREAVAFAGAAGTRFPAGEVDSDRDNAARP